MAQEQTYDAIVIGAGQSGGPLSSALAGAGRRTALIESTHIGGTCINEGCTPTKTMVASARVAYLAGRGAEYGVRTGSVSVDLVKVRQRKRAIVESFRGGSERRIEDTANLDWLRGEARFTGRKTVEVHLHTGEVQTLRAEPIVINTGCRPALPPIAGLPEVGALDSTSIMELDEVPDHLLVLGGGYVGLEFAQMFRRFGSTVTIVQRASQLLAREDADIADAVAEILRQDGIEVLLDTNATATRRDGKAISLDLRLAGGARILTGSHLLVATGRVPNVEALNLAAAGIATREGGFIRVDERLQTNVPDIYASGDVNGGPAFTHISYDDFRILRSNLLEGGSASTTGRLIPYTVFIDPQLGRVGLTEQEARRQGGKIRVARMPMSSVARALEVDEPRGMMKAIVDAESGRIVGCAILGIEGGELMSMLEIAMLGDLPYTTLRDGIFAHPTLAESFNNLFASLED